MSFSFVFRLDGSFSVCFLIGSWLLLLSFKCVKTFDGTTVDIVVGFEFETTFLLMLFRCLGD
jgi:hypothetical protein